MTNPQQIIPLEQILTNNPIFQPKWHVDRGFVYQDDAESPEVIGFSNKDFGAIRRVVVCNPEGKPIYDQYVIQEGPEVDGVRKPTSGAVIVPYFEREGTVYVGTIDTFRAVVYDPNNASLVGRISTELPRGFAKLNEATPDTANRELGEETGKHAITVHPLGILNGNTTFYQTNIGVFAVEVDSGITEALNPQSKEPIMKCEFRPKWQVYDDINAGKMFCGLSMAALTKFDAYQQTAGKRL